MKSAKAEYVLFGIGAILWCIIYANIAPRFLSVDFFQFKDPAINLAMGRGFTMVSDPGHLSTKPVFYSAYPPLYALLYSAYVTVFGIGAYQNTYFDFAIQVLRSLLLVEVLVVTLMKDAARWQRIAITLLIIIALPLIPICDRPEDLMLVTFLASMLALLKIKGAHKLFWAYVFAGVTLTVSPLGGLLNISYIFAAHVYEKWRDDFDFSMIKTEWVPLLGAAIIPGITLAFFFIIDGTAFVERFFMLGVGDNGENWNYVVTHDNPYTKAFDRVGLGMVMFITIGGSLSVFSLRQGFTNSQERSRWWFIAFVIIAINLPPFIIFPHKPYYLYMISLTTIVMFGYFSYSQHIPQRNLLLLLAFILFVMINRQNVVKEVYTRYKSIGAYNAAESESNKLYQKFIKDKSVYIGLSEQPENSYFFLKPVHPNLCVLNNLSKEEVEKLEYIAYGFISNAPGEKELFPSKELHENLEMCKYELLYTVDGTLTPVSPFESRLVRDNESWGYHMYKRK